MDTAQWPQEIVVKPLEEIVTNTRGQNKEGGGGLDVRKSRAQKEQAVLNCPRCNSTNTKFCYYNNYSLTQPRYFCKTCRRYWTEGGSLRNIPVGGGSRKNKRSNSNISNSHTTTTTSSSSIITKNNNIMMTNNNKLPDLVVAPPTLSTTNPKIHEAPITSHDLNLAFPHQDFRTISDLVQDKTHMSSSALELLTGITNSRGFTSFMPTSSVQDPNSVSSLYTNGFSLQEFKPSLGFSLDGLGSSSYGGGEGGGGGGRLLFPFEDLMKQAPSSGNNNNSNDGGGEHDHHHHDHNNQQSRDQLADHISTGGGYWTGMLGGGNW